MSEIVTEWGLTEGLEHLSDEFAGEVDLLHWRIDQLHSMVADLAMRLGQQGLAFDMFQFHEKEVIPAIKKLRNET